MKSCPVCNTICSTPICPECEFDISCHYELYPTLQKLSFFPNPISVCKSMFIPRSNDFEIQNNVLIKYTGNAAHPIIPDGVIEIGEDAFRQNRGICTINIPEGVETIRAHAFDGCRQLHTVFFPSSLKKIGSYAFSSTSIKHIDFPDSLVSLGKEGAFLGTDLEEIIIPSSINVIPQYTFSYCHKLKEATLLPGVSVIEKKAFAECVNLTTLTVPDTLMTVNVKCGNSYSAFEGCKKLNTIIASSEWKQTHAHMHLSITSALIESEVLYQEGELLYQEKKYEEAFSCHYQAAQLDHAMAQYRVGIMYELGEGVLRDETLAAQWYRKSSELGCADAIYRLGRCYTEGKGVCPSAQRAIACYEDAFHKGISIALGDIFIEYNKIGKLKEKDCKHLIALAKTQTETTANYGSNALNNIIDHLPNICMSIAIDMVKYQDTKPIGIKWIEKCAKNGLARAQLWLGESFWLGDGLPKNEQKAIYWYEMAAAQENLLAKRALSTMRKV